MGWSLLAGILVASPERQREGHAGLGQYQRLPGLDQQLAGLGEDSRAGEDLAALTPNGPADHDAESVARYRCVLMQRQATAYSAVISVGTSVQDMAPDGRAVQGRPQDFGGDGAICSARPGRRMPDRRHQRSAVDRSPRDTETFARRSVRTAGKTDPEEVMVESEVALGGSFSGCWHDGLGSGAFELSMDRRCRHSTTDAQQHL